MSARKPIQPFFPVIPEYMSWEDWTGNFIIYYGSQNVMIQPEENWKQAAQQISGIATFGSYPLPNPEGFDKWQDWAREVTTIINGPAY